MSHEEDAFDDADTPIAWDGLETTLRERSPYRPFVNHLAHRNKKLKSTNWGGIPAVDILNGVLEKRVDDCFRNRADGKLLPVYTQPIADYISAHRFLDHLARVEGSTQVSRNVLKQPARDALVGQHVHLNCLSDLGTLLKEFLNAADLCKTFLSQNASQPTVPAGPPVFDSPLTTELQTISTAGVSAGTSVLLNPTTDPLFSIAAELNATVVGKKAMKLIRNLDAVALSIRLIMQGSCLSVPDSYEEVLPLLPPDALPKTQYEVQQLRDAMADPRGLRQAFRLAFLISPLLVLSSGRQLEKYSACPTELLMNNKLLGNCKPAAIEEWEDAVLRGILRIAEGKQTAVQTLIQLADSWRQRPPQLTPEENRYFNQILSKPGSKYDAKMSLLETVAISPHPTSWPLTPSVRSYIGTSGIAETPTNSQHDATTSNLPGETLTSGATTPIPPPSGPASPVPGDDDGAPEDDQSGPAMTVPGDDDGPPEDDQAAATSPEPGDDDDESGERPLDESGPRRSNRERKPPAPPEEKPAWVKGSKPRGRKRQYEQDFEEADDEGDGGMDEEGLRFEPRKLPSMNIRSVHGKGVKKRRELLEESVLKMEEIEPSMMSVDVDDETPRLVIGETVERYSDNEPFTFDAWDGDGNKETLSLECHSQEDFEAWKVILTAIAAQLHPSGRPRFLDDPDNSVLRLCRPESYTKGNTKVLQKIYGRQSIVVPRFSDYRAEWSLDELEFAGDPKQDTSMQDFSIPVVSGDYNDRLVTGNLEQLYTTSISPPGTRKQLSALFFPQPNSFIDPNDPLSTDAKAWWKTKSDPHCLIQLPGRDMRWAIVGTTGAMHYFHVDPRGDGTYVLPRVGLKAWILAMPIDESVLLSAELWTKMELDITKLDFTKWKVEMILLRPGDLLIQLPHVSHAVYTPKHAICSGGHLIAMAALRRSLVGVIHTFFCKEIINIDHPTFACRLNSIVCFLYKAMSSESVSDADAAHLPDIYSVSGVEDLLLLACVIELQNALCPSSYQPTTDQALLALLHQAGHTAESALDNFDISAMSHEMRAQNVFSRGRMQAVLRLVLRRISIFTEEGEMRDPWSQLFIPVIAHFIECLKTYYSLAFDHLINGKKGVTKAKDPALPIPRDRFLMQLRSTTFRWDPVLKDAVKVVAKSKGKSITTFLPPDLRFRVEKKATVPNIDEPDTPPDFRELGMRTLDGLYFTSYNDLVTFGAKGSKGKAGDSAATAGLNRDIKRRRVDFEGAQ